MSAFICAAIRPDVAPTTTAWRAIRGGCLVALALTLALANPTAAQVTRWQPALDDFASALAREVETDAVGGIVAGVVVDGDLVWAEAFGVADREAPRPMSTASILRTGSISKSVTAMLLMRLVDQGVVGLDDAVVRHLPAFARVKDPRPAAPDVTLRHLASHTAGLVREPQWRGAVAGPIEEWENRVLESLPRTAFDSIPGARYQYSNIGFGILGLALSNAAGQDFMELVREEIFLPLGMTGSDFVVVGAELEPRLASGYTVARNGAVSGEQPAREHTGRGYKVPNGGVYSTVADLGRFLGALAGVPGLRLLSEASRQEMIAVHTPEDPTSGYGIGLSVRTDPNGRKIVGHGGSVAGYTAYMALDPASGIGVVLLRNYGGGATNLGRAAETLTSTLAEIGR